MDEKVAIEALKQVKEVFDKHGIEFWLDSGTLLGAVRDGKFIEWDTQFSKIPDSQELRNKELKGESKK